MPATRVHVRRVRVRARLSVCDLEGAREVDAGGRGLAATIEPWLPASGAQRLEARRAKAVVSAGLALDLQLAYAAIREELDAHRSRSGYALRARARREV